MEPAPAPLSVRLTQVVARVRNVSPWLIDALIATAFLVIMPTALANSGPDYREPTAFAYVVAIASVLPYYARRRAPLVAFLISATGLMVLVLRDFQGDPLPLLLLVGTYTVAAYCSARDRLICALALALCFLLLGIFGAVGMNAAGLFANIAIFTAAYFFGATIRNRRLYMEELEARTSALERERDEEAKRAVADERLRIAQELHDVVAHSMGVIAVQAGVGAHVIESDPGEAKKSLEAISTTSRATLTEIRRMLGVLREDSGAGYEPAPDLTALPRLVDSVRAAGLDVAMDVEGASADVPPGVSFTAYRIVQEALTNVMKHAGPARATVLVGYEPGVVRLEVSDDGRGVNGRSADGGHGLVGMRERVAVYGGTLTAAPKPGGGFKVAATLPYGENT
ncbi:MAG: sensor histidine kinase [Acidimicrobiia bacterium]